MLQARPEVIFPTISVDRSYGESTTHFDVDLEAITEYLRSRGLSDNEISDLSIHFSAEENRSKTHTGTNRTFGRYIFDKKHIDMYRPQTLFGYSVSVNEESGKTMYVNGDHFTNDEMSSTLVHEFEHYIDDISGELDDEVKEHQNAFKKQAKKITIKRGLSGLAITGGIIGAHQLASPLVSDAIEAQGGDSTWSGLAMTALGVGAAIIASRRNSKAMARDFSKLHQTSYQHSPIELKARAAEETYSEAFMDVRASNERCDDITQLVQSTLTRLGEHPEVIRASVDLINAESK